MLTLTKLAKLAHVSVSTASKAFSMSDEVSEQTRDEIFRIAKEYGCFKKFYTAKYPKFVVAVLCPEFRGRFYTGITAALQDGLNRLGCEVCAASTNFSAQTEQELVNYYHDYSKVDGVIVINGRMPMTSHYEIPVISMMPLCAQSTDVCLEIDHTCAVAQAIDHFISCGVTKIAFLGEGHTAGKQSRFQRFMEERGLDGQSVFVSRLRFEQGGYEAMEQILALSEEDRPRAVVCAYDNMAIGAMKCLADHGLSVPGDMAVVGMNNIPEAEYLVPPLASVDSHVDEICRTAAQAMVDLLNGGQVETRMIFPADFILRDSARID